MNLYASLNNWGLQHPEAIQPFGYLRRRIQWRALISTDKHPTTPTITGIAIVKLEETKPGSDKKGTPLLTVASQGPRSGKQILPQLASDTLKYALPGELSGEDLACHQAWCDLLDEAAAAVPDCRSLTVVRNAADSPLFATALNALRATTKVPASDHIDFHVDGENPTDRPDVQAWWEDRIYQADAKRVGEQMCAATGRMAVVARLIPQVTINGKQESISSADGQHASHYGRSKGEVATIDTRVVHRAIGALAWLTSNRTNNRRFGDKTLVWWTDGPAPDDLEALLACEFTDTDFANELATRQLTGPADTTAVHAALIGTRKGRHYIAAAFDAPVNELRTAVRRWQQLTTVIDPWTGLPVHLTLAQIAHATERPLASPIVNERRAAAVAAAALLPFAYGQTNRIPASLLPKVIASINIHLATAPNPTKGYNALSDRTQAAHIAALQLCLYNPQEPTMPYLHEESDSAAYQLGRYFAVAEHLQRKAMPGIARGLAAKRLKDFLRAPRRAFTSLEEDLLPYINKLTKGNQAPYETRTMNEIASRISEIPERFTAAEQADFHLGRRHQTASDIAAAVAHKAEQAAAADNSSTPSIAAPAQEAAA